MIAYDDQTLEGSRAIKESLNMVGKDHFVQ